jgi:hypothetical protein
MSITSICPKCGNLISGPFPQQCPYCPFNLSALVGRGTTAFQVMKWEKHSDLLFGRNIQLANGETYNTSFNFNGYAQLEDIVRFSITFGDRTTILSPHGGHQNQLIVSYIPEQLGAGTAIYSPGTIPCSGICLISPQSNDYAHSFPVIDDWVQATFAGATSSCRICSAPTAFGQPICAECYAERGSDWHNFIY